MRSISILAHNIRSLWNVGSFFRSADAFSAHHLYLTGYTPCPPREEISKTALGAEMWIPWTYKEDPLDVVEIERKKGSSIIALEKTEGSVPLSSFEPSQSILLIVGHEVLGVPELLLQKTDAVVHIPMHGKKESLNVAVALGIALDRLRHS